MLSTLPEAVMVGIPTYLLGIYSHYIPNHDRGQSRQTHPTLTSISLEIETAYEKSDNLLPFAHRPKRNPGKKNISRNNSNHDHAKLGGRN